MDYRGVGFGVKIDVHDQTNGSAQAWDRATDTVSGTADTLISIENAIGTDFDDRFVETPGIQNTFDGHGGTNDSIDYGGRGAGMNINLNGAGSEDTLFNIENVVGTTYLDRFIDAESVANILDGNGGDDVIDYSAFSQGVTTNLADGTDSDGNTLIGFVDAKGSAYDDTFVDAEGVGNEYDGAGGTNTIDYSAYTKTAFVDLELGMDLDGNTLINISNVIGSTRNDIIGHGGASGLSHVYDGNDGIDTLAYVYETGPLTVNLSAGTDSLGNTFSNIEGIVTVSVFSQPFETAYVINGVTHDFSTFDYGDPSDTIVYHRQDTGNYEILAWRDDVNYGGILTIIDANGMVVETFEGLYVAPQQMYNLGYFGVGTDFDDYLTGDAGGRALNDIITGAGGDDIAIGGSGNDTLAGGAGDDVKWSNSHVQPS